jgi:hypothetical protein
MQIDASKVFSALTAAQIPLDIMKNTPKNFVLHRNPAGNARKLWMPDVDQIMETRDFCSHFFDARVGKGFIDTKQVQSCGD